MTATFARAPTRDLGRAASDIAPSDLAEGTRLGRFRIERVLDWSGTARVYAARDAGTNEAVAIKLGQPRRGPDGRFDSDEAVLARLRREAEMLRHLDCAGVPRVRELSERPPYLVLEMIDGLDLERALSTRERALAASDIATLCADLADILTAVHARGFLHGDVKPSNILLRPSGSPLLVDFESARRLVGPEAEDGDDGSATPGYAPPEFHRADVAIGPWSDVYALGAVAYRALVGRPPMPAEARLRGASMASAAEAAGPSCPPALSAVIDWALELDPAARPFSAEEWRCAIRRAVGASADADARTLRIRRRLRPDVGAPGPADKPGSSARRSARAWKVAAGVAVLASAGALLAGPDLYARYENHVKQAWMVDAGGHGDATTIAAILARARDGATIQIRPGLYQESLVVARPVELRGLAEDGRQPTIAPAAGSCITVTATAARISNLLLRGAGDADTPCVDIASGQADIENTRIAAASGTGVLVRNGAALHLVDSAIQGSGGAGVLLAGGAKAVLSGGEIRDSGLSGVIARSGADLRLTGTRVIGAREAGLLLAEGAAAHVDDATIDQSGTSAIEIGSGARATIAGGALAHAAQAGIFVADSGKIAVERTQIVGNGFSGLVVAGGGEARLEAAVLEENREHGALLLDLANGTIINSRISGNGGHGIAVQRGATGEMTGNVVERNQEPQVYDARRTDAKPPDRR